MSHNSEKTKLKLAKGTDPRPPLPITTNPQSIITYNNIVHVIVRVSM